jgi:hypothetical protein
MEKNYLPSLGSLPTAAEIIVFGVGIAVAAALIAVATATEGITAASESPAPTNCATAYCTPATKLTTKHRAAADVGTKRAKGIADGAAEIDTAAALHRVLAKGASKIRRRPDRPD